MKSSINLIFFVTFLSIVIISGCDEQLPSENDIPDSNVSYSIHIQPISNVKCAISGCHDDATMASGYSLTSYTNMFRIPQVLAGDPDNSTLVMRITGMGGFPPMPPIDAPVTPLTEREVNGIKTWIREGAKNN